MMMVGLLVKSFGYGQTPRAGHTVSIFEGSIRSDDEDRPM